MNLEEYSDYDGLGLAELVNEGEVTPSELAGLALSGVERVNPELNAVIEVYRERIDDLDESTLPDGPFRGVPFFLKDLGVLEAGKKSECGSRMMRGFVADHESTLVTRFKQAGLNNLGRTTCPEFGFTFCTESVQTGVTVNPWDPERIPGGSSGGSAAIVAAGVAPMAHANDGGGSIRLPASICGLVGLKCSRGRVTQGPDAGDVMFPLFSDLVVSRTVRDTAAVLDAVAGPMPGESTMYQRPERPFLEELWVNPGKLRIALSTSGWGTRSASAEVRSQIEQIGQLLVDLGHDVTEDTPALDYAEFYDVFTDLFSLSAPGMLDMLSTIVGRAISPDTIEPILLKAYERGKGLNATVYTRIMTVMNIVSRQLGDFFTRYDVLLTPTLAIPTPKTGVYHLNRPEISFEDYFSELMDAIPFTPLNNFTGTPAISLPLCQTGNGMPLGAHFAAPIGEEARLLRLAGSLEQAQPWRERRPRIHVAREK